MVSTKEELQELVQDKLADRLLIIVSNREPYIHVASGKDVECIVPASGLTMALDPVMRACGGSWVAHGSGSADKEVVDENSRVMVPPDEQKYSLRRVWLTKEEEEGYYLGFSNEALWPLCHVAYTPPDMKLCNQVSGKIPIIKSLIFPTFCQSLSLFKSTLE